MRAWFHYASAELLTGLPPIAPLTEIPKPEIPKKSKRGPKRKGRLSRLMVADGNTRNDEKPDRA